MTSSFRLRKAHAAFLVSCRNRQEGRDYWAGVGPKRRWILETLTPRPLLNLLTHGRPLAEALGRLERECKLRPLGEDVLREYHRDLAPDHDALYRDGPVESPERAVKPPPATAVPMLMRHLAKLAAERQAAWDASPPSPDELLRGAVDVYQRLGAILPFRDANGRLARLAMNHLLRRYDGPYVILPPLAESPELRSALEHAHRADLGPLIDLALAHRHRV